MESQLRRFISRTDKMGFRTKEIRQRRAPSWDSLAELYRLGTQKRTSNLIGWQTLGFIGWQNGETDAAVRSGRGV